MNWTQVIDNNRCADIYYIDLKRAFDSVSINKLIHKSKHIGISHHYVSWLSTFLFNSQLSVMLNDTLSNSFVQISGVAQGTSIEPLCFLIYINDLSMSIKYCILKLFADDAKIYFCYPRVNWSDLLQINLNKITQWALL